MIQRLMMSIVRITIFVFFTALIPSGCSDKEDTLIPESELPDLSRSYIKTNFPDVVISQVWKDKDGSSMTYEVSLANGVYLEFNKGGSVIKIESYSGIPKNVIPEKIDAYVNEHYASQKIVQWELDNNREQDVTLFNGLELVFDLAGNFIRIDR